MRLDEIVGYVERDPKKIQSEYGPFEIGERVVVRKAPNVYYGIVTRNMSESKQVIVRTIFVPSHHNKGILILAYWDEVKPWNGEIE